MNTARALLLALGAMVWRSAMAQPSSCPALGIPCDPASYFCWIGTDSIEGVDLDGDGVDDFEQGRFRVYTQCAGGNWHYRYDDSTAGLFPVSGVGIYVKRKTSGYPNYMPILAEGEAIDPQPATTGAEVWEWDPAGFMENLSIYGLGYTWRYLSQYPCGGSVPCSDVQNMGWLSVTNPAYFGFRIPHDDGWHLGWLKLEWTGQTQNGYRLVRLVDNAVEPQPNTAIRAGKRPRPPLSIALLEGRIRVSWPNGYPGFALERSRSVAAGAWEPAPGVTNNAVLMEPSDAPRYLRLRR